MALRGTRGGHPTIFGIDHGFSFPIEYFDRYCLPRDWPNFLVDFALRGRKSIILAMQEVLSKTVDQEAPLRGQEFYELSLRDEANDLGTRYCVRQAHAEWSEIDGQVMWNQEKVEHFWILDEAKRRYAERRLALAEKGFIYSDMDM